MVARFVKDVVAEPASLMGFDMYNLGHFPALVKGTGSIVGETFTVPSITIFDHYEGYRPDGSGLYDREQVEINTASGDKTAWVYFMKQTPRRASLVPTGDWADAS